MQAFSLAQPTLLSLHRSLSPAFPQETPAPTTKPLLAAEAVANLFGRQASIDTCGFFSGKMPIIRSYLHAISTTRRVHHADNDTGTGVTCSAGYSTEWRCATVNSHVIIEPNTAFTTGGGKTDVSAPASASPSPTESGSDSGSGNSDSNSCGNQIDGNLVEASGGILVEGGNCGGSSTTSRGSAGGSGGGGGNSGAKSSSSSSGGEGGGGGNGGNGSNSSSGNGSNSSSGNGGGSSSVSSSMKLGSVGKVLLGLSILAPLVT
ncbi:MAG: hypothetical protein Q9227_001697 [Pyrenula ochraceoflavens]